MQKIYLRAATRIMPFLILLYVVAFLDRVNVGFAALTMNHDLGISDQVYGAAAGVFFLGYFLFEVPSNLLLNRFGARIWIARIMVSWGALSIGMAFVHGPYSYIALRAFLGAAEAGFFPGIILYMTFWFPPSKRAGLMALFTFAIPFSNAVGAPISTAILKAAFGLGLRPWQWLFIAEGFPAIVLGCLVPLVLADSPNDVRWLTPEEKHYLVQAQRSEAPADSKAQQTWRDLVSKTFLTLTLIYFFMMASLYGISFWLPRMFQARGASLSAIGWMSGLAYAIGGIFAVIWAYHSDTANSRRGHLIVSFVVSACGQVLVAGSHSEGAAISGFALSAFGLFSAMPIFWSLITNDLAGRTAAICIAFVNSLGNLGGFVGPSAVGWATAKTGSFAVGLLSLSGLLLVASALSWLVVPKQSLHTQGEV